MKNLNPIKNILDGVISEEDISFVEEQEGLTFLADPGNLKADRRTLLKSLDTIDVQACPGSGKTTLISTKLMVLSREWSLKNKGICVLSHTNVAKDEIVNAIKNTSILEARKLLSYPNFIGTIQEFIDKYLALPYLRSRGISDIRIDNELYAKNAIRILQRNEFAWFRGTLNGLGDADSQQAFIKATYAYFEGEKLRINIQKTAAGWRSSENLDRAYNNIKRLKSYLANDGCFLFRDMYTYATKALIGMPDLAAFLQRRFPCVFIDEMQDTQKFQDELLQRIFPLDKNHFFVQRFGDPDQAIFNNIEGEEPNGSYNAKRDMDFVVNLSHRFNVDISNKIKGFSFNQVPLGTELNAEMAERRRRCHSDGSGFMHTIFIYDDATINKVIPEFIELVDNQFAESYKKSDRFIARIVGAVGNELTNPAHLKIKSYWPEYDKANAKRYFKPSTFLKAVKFFRQLLFVDWLEGYQFIDEYFLLMLREANIKTVDERYFNPSTWKRFLEDRRYWERYRKLVYSLLNPRFELDRVRWACIESLYKNIFNVVDIPDVLKRYLEYSDEELVEIPDVGEPETLTQLEDNVIRHVNGFNVSVTTIHAVKGETHDATLILETKNHGCPDVRSMIPYLLRQLPTAAKPNSALKESPTAVKDLNRMANRKYMKQLFVASSRARHLLCISLHKDGITDEIEKQLADIGWSLNKLY